MTTPEEEQEVKKETTGDRIDKITELQDGIDG